MQYTWRINVVQCDEQNIIKYVDWELTADDNTNTASVSGIQYLLDTVVNLDITDQQIIDSVKDSMGEELVHKYTTMAQSKLENIKP